jgi:RND family efflux transporter MFP subunit
MNAENNKPETKSTNAAPPEAAAEINKHPPKASRRSRFLVIGTVTVALAAGLAGGVVSRLRAQSKLVAAVQQAPRATVAVTNANHEARVLELTLPGDVHAYEQTRIYARADGYLLKWHTDIGATVEAGQLLAEIDTPELDQELNQSLAALAQAHANLVLARSSAERWLGLLKERAVSQQEVDEKTGALAAREADVKAAEAAVLRFTKLASFKEVRAPFAGIITGRFVDTGALIRAGGSATSLFELAQTDRLRVHVNVPQAYLRDVTTGSAALVRVAEYPDRTFSGKIVRTSGAFDPTTRTLLTEIEVPNDDGALFPGIHVDVQLSLAQADPPLVVPATAVLIRSDGVHVAVVDAGGGIRLRTVQLGRDFGKSLEIVAGLNADTRIVANPNDTLVDGQKVIVAGEPQRKTAAAQLARR